MSEEQKGEGGVPTQERLSRAASRPEQFDRRRWILRLSLVAVFLLAFATRVYDLDGQSIWNDEGLSIYRARQSIPTILANTITIDGVDTPDTNPPLYFLLLHLWRTATGESIFALRYLSALAGVLSVGLIYQIGRSSFNRLVGAGAAFLLALSPFHVWMSQEIRNYTLLLFLNLLSVFGLFRYANEQGQRGSWRWLLLWASAGVIGIYTHFFGALVFGYGILAAGWLWLSGAQKKGRWRPSRGVVIALIVIGLISAPILWAGFTRLRGGRQVDFVFVPLQHLTSHAVSVFSVGLIPTVVQPLWRVAPAVILAVVGAVAGWFSNRSRNRQRIVLLILGYLILPFLFLFALSAINPIYNGPRHLLISLPPFLLLVAAGLGLPWSTSEQAMARGHTGHERSFWLRPGPWRFIVTALGVWLVVSQASWLHTQFTDDSLVKDDFQGLAAYLGRVANEDDLIVLHDTISGPVFAYYYDGAADWTAIPTFAQSGGDTRETIADFQAAGEGAKRLWFVSEPAPRNGFPRQLLREWAANEWPVLTSFRFPSLWLRIKLDGYVPDPASDQLPDGVEPLDIRWGNELRLHGFEIPETGQAGEYWQPTLYWSKEEVNPEGYSLSFRFTDDQGRIWAQIDQSLWRQYPPDQWPDSSLIRYQPVLQLPAGVPPGEYQVRLRVSQAGNMEPLLADGEAEIMLAPSVVVETAVHPEHQDALPPHIPVNVTFGGQIEVVGVSALEGVYKPGHAVPIDVLWRVRRRPSADYILQAQLLDSRGEVVSENRSALTRSDYPPTKWQADEYLSGHTGLVVPATAEAGDYTVRLQLLDPDSLAALQAGWIPGRKAVELGGVTVAPWQLETNLPPIPVALRADFGQPAIVELHGYDVTGTDGQQVEEASAGDVLALTLFWRSLSDSMTTSYSVLVHLTDERGEIVTQGDGPPAGGFRPTTSWRNGEVIVDEHQLPIPSDLEAGSYDLWVGLYDPETFQRLPALVAEERQADDRLLLDRIRVSP